jgi:hypothetical protein
MPSGSITCPWCGTNYAAFQTNCRNCGGPLPAPDGGRQPAAPSIAGWEAELAVPPPAPRPIADSYAWRLLWTDGWAIAAGVFTLLGAVFTLVGSALTLGIITAFVGLPFLGLGVLFLALGGYGLNWRYRAAQQTVNVLRHGEAARGEITGVEENYSVRVNGRHPWIITYRFQALGREHTGQVSTLNPPGSQLRPGQPACVLYLPNTPEHNALYPHP